MIDIASPLLIINPSSQYSAGQEAAQLLRSAEYPSALASQTIWNLAIFLKQAMAHFRGHSRIV
jgi:hypothetical protein